MFQVMTWRHVIESGSSPPSALLAQHLPCFQLFSFIWLKMGICGKIFSWRDHQRYEIWNDFIPSSTLRKALHHQHSIKSTVNHPAFRFLFFLFRSSLWFSKSEDITLSAITWRLAGSNMITPCTSTVWTEGRCDFRAAACHPCTPSHPGPSSEVR